MKRKLITTDWPFAVCCIHACLADDYKAGDQVTIINLQRKAISKKTITSITIQGSQAVLVELNL